MNFIFHYKKCYIINQMPIVIAIRSKIVCVISMEWLLLLQHNWFSRNVELKSMTCSVYFNYYGFVDNLNTTKVITPKTSITRGCHLHFSINLFQVTAFSSCSMAVLVVTSDNNKIDVPCLMTLNHLTFIKHGSRNINTFSHSHSTNTHTQKKSECDRIDDEARSKLQSDFTLLGAVFAEKSLAMFRHFMKMKQVVIDWVYCADAYDAWVY